MRVAERHGTDDLTLCFTDTLIEDRDLYRFLLEGAAAVLGLDREMFRPALKVVADLPPVREDTMDRRKTMLAMVRDLTTATDDRLVWLRDGRTPVEVFFDVGFLGNTRADPCSRVLKRDLFWSWMADTYEVGEAVTYIGLDWTEQHRFDGFRRTADPWDVEAPMTDPPLMMKDQMIQWARDIGIEPPRLYAMGFGHNNCSGGCVKGGHGQWALLLRQRPEYYRYWEEAEQRFRDETGHDVAILRDRRGGDTKPFTLAELRDRVSCGAQIDMMDQGGCGCFVDVEEAP